MAVAVAVAVAVVVDSRKQKQLQLWCDRGCGQATVDVLSQSSVRYMSLRYTSVSRMHLRR